MNPIKLWVLRTMMKGQTGVMRTLPKKDLVDFNVNMTIERLLQNRIDPSTIKTPDQLDNIIKQIEAPRNVQTGIRNTESAKVFDLKGKEIPKGSQIMGGEAVETEAEIAARMNRENKLAVQNLKIKKEYDKAVKEGKFKGTEEDFRNKIDMMMDDIDNDFAKGGKADYADGGVAGMLGERPGYSDGLSVLDNFLAVASVPYNFAKGIIGNPSNPGAVTDVSLTSGQKNFLDNIAKSKNKKSGTIDYSDYGSPTKTFSGISEMSPMQASLATTMGGTGFNIKPDGSVDYTGGAYDFNMGNVVTDFIDEGGIYGLIDRLQGNPQVEDDFDIKSIVAKDLLSKKQIEQAKTFQKMKEAELAKEAATDGGGGGKDTDGGSGTKGFSAPTKQGQSPRGSTTGGNGGGGGGKGFDAPSKQGQSPRGSRTGKNDGGIAGMRTKFKKGGMKRRTFLKMLGGAMAIPIVSKFLKPFKIGKTITKVPVIKTADVPGKPEWFDALVNKVILEGDDVTKQFATKERQIVHTTKIDDQVGGPEVRVTQDLDDGVIRVEYDSVDNMYEDPVQLRYKKPLPDEENPRPAAEFDVAESGPVARADGPDDYAIDIDEIGGTSISDLTSDVSKLKEYATGQKQTLKEFLQSKKRKDKTRAISEGDREAETDFIINRQGEPIIDMEPDIDDAFASGGIARMLGE